MNSLKGLSLLLLPLLVAITSPLRCSSFALLSIKKNRRQSSIIGSAPASSSSSSSSSSSRPSINLPTVAVVSRCPPLLLRAIANNDEETRDATKQRRHHALSIALAAIVTTTLAAPIAGVAPHNANAAGLVTLPTPSIVVSSIFSSEPLGGGREGDIISSSIKLMASSTKNDKNNINDDEIVIDVLARETRADEKIAAEDARRARIEKSREAFFDYEARMAEEAEDRIEAAEMKAEVEVQIDKKRVRALKELESKAEEEASVAETPRERAARLRRVRELERLEKIAERKERRAERAEQIYLAEEKQEKLILQQKEEAALKEEKKFEAVEKEYEVAAELAKEEELELSLVKGLSSKK